MTQELRFDKILVGRESPQNNCKGPDGERLVPATTVDASSARLRKDAHFFVSLVGRHTNAYGWVASLAQPMTPEELLAADRASLRGKLGDDAEIEMPPLEWYVSYLRSVGKRKADEPMACHWRDVRGPGVNRRELSVHKVIFHDQES